MFALRKCAVRGMIRVSAGKLLRGTSDNMAGRGFTVFQPNFAFNKYTGKRSQSREEHDHIFDNQTSLEEQNIVRDKLRVAFNSNVDMSPGDWDKLVDSILGLPVDRHRLVTQVNVTAVILKFCEEMDKIKMAKSYSECMGLLNKDPSNLYPLLRTIIACKIEDEDEFVINVAKKFIDSEDILTVQRWYGIQAITKTKAWRTGLEMYLTDARLTVNDGGGPVCVQVAADLAIKALEQDDIDTMWKIMEHSHFHENNIPLRDQAGLGHRDRERVFKAWISHCARLRNKAEGLRELEKLFLYLQKHGLHLSKEILFNLKDLYRGNPKGEKCTATISKISFHSGACLNCGERLKKEELTETEVERLKSSILEIVLKGEDTYQNTNPQELDFFLKMLSKQGEFDVVIDGLNVALTRIPGIPPIKPIGLSSVNLLETVLYFHKQGKRILVIHRPSIKTYPHYAQILELSHLHILDKLTQDDPYFILAALHSGNSCLCVTSDLLRQHLVRLVNFNPELGKLFNRWQVAHQVYVTGFEKVKSSYSGKPGLIFPPKYTVSANKTGCHWHVPLLTTPTNNPGSNPVQERTVYHGYIATWACVGPEVRDQRGESSAREVDSTQILDSLGKKKKKTMVRKKETKFKVKNVFD